MGRTIDDWQDRTQTLLGDPKPTPAPESIQDHVLAAIRRFSADIPRITYADYPGDGVTFDLNLPTGWVPGFSRVVELEYPQGQRPAEYLDLQEVSLYPRDSAPTKIRLRDTTPATGSTTRVYYAIPWPIPTDDPSIDKISDLDFEPVAHLAAAYAALELSGDAAGHTRSSIPGANIAGDTSEYDRWIREHERHLELYFGHVGSVEGGALADGIIDWDARSTFVETRGRFLFRGRR